MERQAPNSSILRLPSEVILSILSLLKPHDWAQVSQTCKTLYKECNSTLEAFTFLDLKNGGHVLDDDYFRNLSKKLGKNLRRIELDCWHLSDSSVECIPKSVEELVLCGCDHHSNQILSKVSQQLNGGLRIFAWSGFGGKVSAEGFNKLVVNSSKLTSFMIDSGASVDTNEAVCTVARNCPLLRELSACNLTMDTLSYIFDCGIALQRFRHKQRQIGSFHITDATLLLLSEKCPSLKELQLVDKTTEHENAVLTDVGLLCLAERFSTLRVIKLKPAQCSTASEVAIMQLANFCSYLSQVELSNFKYLGDPPIYELVQKCCNNLTELALDYSPITDTSLELISHYCKNLQTISVKCCKRLTDAGLRALGRCATLTSVNLGQASGLTDGALIAVCTGNPLLKVLVAGYGQVSDRSLKAVATCKNMRELALNNCSRITNHGLKQIAKGCPMLRYISLSYCEYITDSGVIALANGCPRLLKVRLDGCRLLSNPSIRILCIVNKKLRYLSMQHCMKLSDDIFQYLLCAASLRFVDLGRAKLTNGAIESYHHQRPFIEIFVDGRPYS